VDERLGNSCSQCHTRFGHKSHQSGRGELEHGSRLPAADEATGRDVAAELDHAAFAVEEKQVEWEPHSQRVHAAATRDEKPAAGALTGEQREAEQAAEPGRRNADLEAEEAPALEGAEPEGNRIHIPVSAGEAILAPAVPLGG
jgi:hypothetical protein